MNNLTMPNNSSNGNNIHCFTLLYHISSHTNSILNKVFLINFVAMGRVNLFVNVNKKFANLSLILYPGIK